MSPIDLDKTRIFAGKADTESTSEPNPAEPAWEAVVTPAEPYIKPKIKTLTKVEQLSLVAGGMLTLGLGTIVIAGMDERAVTTHAKPVAPAPVIKPLIASENSDTPANEPSPPPISEPKPTTVSHHTATPEIAIPDELAVSTGITDEMDFETAFNAARSEVGPGGLFVWNDTYYSTFRQAEWERLPDARKQQWLSATEPLLEPASPEPDAANPLVAVAESGMITWTGVDRDQDGIAEVLIAHTKGKAPIVMMDTDGDLMLDAKFGLDTAGQLVNVSLEKSSFPLADVPKIPETPVGEVFDLSAGQSADASAQWPISIVRDHTDYLIGMDLNNDYIVDVVSLSQEDKSPFTAMDLDEDGQIETSFYLNNTDGRIQSVELDPLDPITVFNADEDVEASYTQMEFEHHDHFLPVDFEHDDEPGGLSANDHFYTDPGADLG